MLFLPLFTSTTIAILLQLVAHLFVERWLPKMKYVSRLTVGTLCMLIPPTVVLLLDKEWQSVLIIWCSASFSGLTIMIIRWYEAYLNDLRDKLDELDRLKSRERIEDASTHQEN